MQSMNTEARRPLFATTVRWHGIGGQIRRGLRSPRTLTVLLALNTVLTVLPWWNRYLAVTNDGWHFLFGEQILAGRIPYRDFYMYLPPALALKNALCIALFGHLLIGPQLIAIAELIVLVVVLYYWLSALFGSFAGFSAALISVQFYVVASSTETLGSLAWEAVFFPVLAIAAATAAVDKASYGMAALSGVFAGLSFLGKQTSGIAVTAMLLMAIPSAIWLLVTPRKGMASLAAFSAGWSVPVGSICIWLGHNGALGAFIGDVFIQGPASKGSIWAMGSRQFRALLGGGLYSLIDSAAALLLVAAMLIYVRPEFMPSRENEADLPGRTALWGSSACLLAVVVGWLLSRTSRPVDVIHPFILDSISNVAILAGEFGCAVIFFIIAKRCWAVSAWHVRPVKLLLGSGLAGGLAFALSASWPTYGSMLVPAFSFTLAFVLQKNSPRLRMLRPALVAGCVAALALLTWMKLEAPYNWGSWREPNIKAATQLPTLPELRGLRMSRETAEIVNRITADIQKYSRPDEPIFVYPNLALFYVLSHRMPATFAYIHYIDVCPDFIDKADAAAILAKRPAVIVYIRQTEAQLLGSEKNFRGGRRSGLRDMLAAIDKLESEYRIADTFTTPTGSTGWVLVRTEPASVKAAGITEAALM